MGIGKWNKECLNWMLITFCVNTDDSAFKNKNSKNKLKFLVMQ